MAERGAGSAYASMPRHERKPIEEQRRERKVYLDVLRTLAIFSVVVIHVAANNWYSVDIASLDWQAFNAYDSLVRWSVPMFVMISGALFLDPDREVPTRRLYKKNVVRIVVAFIVWSIAYVLFGMYVTDSIHTKSEIFAHLVKGEYHLWFLWMIVGLYIVTPILRRVTSSPKATRYFVIVALIFSFCIPTIEELASSLLPVLDIEQLSKAFSSLSKAYGQMRFHLTLWFVAYFVLGYYLSQKSYGKGQRGVLYVLGIASFAFIVLYSRFISLQTGEAYGFYDWMLLPVMLEAAAIFVFFKQVGDKRSARAQGGEETLAVRVFKFISVRSFGVYLVHIMVLRLLMMLTPLNPVAINPVLSVPLIAIIVFAISLAISALLHRIPLVGRCIT
ncbi:MAG: acyltransferase family protein [bacterium]|nr:acyltransferase family protein [bacterium]